MSQPFGLNDSRLALRHAPVLLFAVLELEVIDVEFLIVVVAFIKRPLVEIFVAIRAVVWIVV